MNLFQRKHSLEGTGGAELSGWEILAVSQREVLTVQHAILCLDEWKERLKYVLRLQVEVSDYLQASNQTMSVAAFLIGV